MLFKRYIRFLFTFVLILLSWNVFAITDEEIFRNFQFSFVNPGARSSAMGGAFIGLADDATAAEANPAGLTILTKPEVSLEYRNTQFDATRLNAFNFIEEEGANLSIGSFNTAEEINQPSFLSVVFPSGGSTYAFSRQEVVRIEGGIDEVFIVNLPGVPEFAFGSTGSQEQKIVNYNFSYGTKLGDHFSVGGTARYSRIDWQANVQNFLLGDGLLFETSLVDDQDSAFAWNAGALYQFGPHGAVGVVYKRNPKFELNAVEIPGAIINKPGPFVNVLKVPDTFGFGVSIKPNDRLSIVSDVVRVMYSDLTEDIEVGRNVLTAGLTDADITYKIDDAWDFHIGAEFIVFVGTVPVALRQGYYHKSSNSLVLDSAPGLNENGRNLLNSVFTEQEDEHHFTLGNGFVFGPHFQVDWAIDLANTSDSFVLSSVVRF